MNNPTIVITLKAAVAFFAPGLLAFTGSLSQWSNETANPSLIQWLVISATSLGAGMTGLGSFLSKSWADHVANGNGNGNGNGKTNDTATKTP